jgi:SAM-dependent methyltransferase
MPSAVSVYESGLTRRRVAITVQLSDGTSLELPIGRYLGTADPVDESLLETIRGPVLDVGCGPGRHLQALARRGVFALGVDLSAEAVHIARSGGANAIIGSIFGELPGVGTWQTALLLDGNIGIGGVPARLLRRIAALLDRNGEVLVELDPPGTPSGAVNARLDAGGVASAWFPWARVAPADLVRVADRAGFVVRDRWCSSGRWFGLLGR